VPPGTPDAVMAQTGTGKKKKKKKKKKATASYDVIILSDCKFHNIKFNSTLPWLNHTMQIVIIYQGILLA
jgi:hypothetical protein